mmetsp:Transcript_39966/g.96398  ORF Transcript_39966/g.96398 Transcript_39966/m.96398 type:complete len:452 (+) Transcript_39966:185-1540(+)
MINKLHVAVEMGMHDRFYLPHNLDFRGRTYPVPPHLNQMGSDVCRGLLTFAEGKPLGRRGLYNLRVHLANLFGANKITFDQRAAWSEEREGKILQSADSPLSEESLAFWLEADDPWQALATCFEIAEAVRSGDPESYVCNLPVHQDGSCNGLQHYAAMGLDITGGEQVNLVPGEKPSDPYTTVMKRVVALVEEDCESEDEDIREAALLVRGKIDRKVVKQTVMTTVYGVTLIGAKDQIGNRLHEKFGDAGDKSLTEEEVSRAALYLAKTTLKSVGDIFVGARDVMDYLREVASTVASTGEAVKWTTPLGLKVIQPYKDEKPHEVKTVVQRVRLVSRENMPVKKQKQKTAFPPNFVHSLDSTHLLMTALKYCARGKTFAGVHDSYWTHACDVEELALELREQFIKLYKLPILEDLERELLEYYPHLEGKLPPIPKKGDLDLEVVKRSPYFFS